MAKISEYLKLSSSRLGMVWGLIGTIACSFATVICWIFAKNEPNGWIALIDAIPGIIGCLPYILSKPGKAESIIKEIKGN